METLSILHILDRINKIAIPDKYGELEIIRFQMLSSLDRLQKMQNQLILEGKLSLNGALDFPPEIIIRILKGTDWNPEVRSLNRYIFDAYNRYNKLKVVITHPSELDHIRKSSMSPVIDIKYFIPDSLRGVYSINIGSISGDNLIELLLSSNILELLTIWTAEEGNDNAEVIANFLRNNNTLTSLLLPNNKIDDLGAELLAQAIKINKTLNHINLANNLIEDSGALALSNALKFNKTIYVDLVGNPIGEVGITHLLPYRNRVNFDI